MDGDIPIEHNDIFHYINLIQTRLIENPDDWFEVILLGWSFMLRESHPSVDIDTVLEAGFSPLSWEISLTNCSYPMARIIATHVSYIEPDEDFIPALFTSLNLNDDVELPDDYNELCDNIIDILHWNDAIATINPNVVKIIGYTWYIEIIRTKINHRVDSFEDQCLLIQFINESLSVLLDTTNQGIDEYLRQVEDVVNIEFETWDMSFLQFPFGV